MMQVLEVLLAASADLESKDGKANTPLHYAAGYARPDFVKRLLQAGASKSPRNDSNHTAFDLIKCASLTLPTWIFTMHCRQACGIPCTAQDTSRALLPACSSVNGIVCRPAAIAFTTVEMIAVQAVSRWDTAR